MKKFLVGASLLCTLLFACFTQTLTVQAKEDDTIKKGVYAGDISLEGMTKEEAETAIRGYVGTLGESQITLTYAEDKQIVVSANDLGIAWNNPEILDEAMQLGKQGNIVARYKAAMDLEHENQVYPIDLRFDKAGISAILTEQCVPFDQAAVDYTLMRENGVFSMQDGQTGYRLEVEQSANDIYTYLTTDWTRDNAEIQLVVVAEEPRGNKEELALVKDVLGTYTTSYKSSGSSRSANVENGCKLINGILLYPGDEFSTYQVVAPFTKANGYYMAGSYLNGKVVDSLGGGICQVSTTLYNAVLLSELEVTERHNHSMIVNYVSPSADAAIAESSGKDFKFKNNTEHPIYIEGVCENKKITFTIYGVESRAANREVIYSSEILEVNRPTTDAMYPDVTKPIGYISVSSAHIGYKARLWKIVKEDGVEVSREIVNSSNYKMSPRSAVVGVSTPDANAYNEMMAAIGTGSIDHVRNVAALLTAPPAAQ